MSDPSHSAVPPQLKYPNIHTLPETEQPPFETRTSIISFSYDATTRTVQWDSSALRYYVRPPSRANLSYRYNRFILHEHKGRIDPLLEAFQHAKHEHGTDLSNGVVSWRGVMAKVLASPYEKRCECAINVMHVNGTLYFERYISDDEAERNRNMNVRQRKQMYYGYAFESYTTSATAPRTEGSTSPGWGGDVNTNVRWANVVKLHLGDTQLLIGGKVDCVQDRYAGDNKPGNTCSFVELNIIRAGLAQSSPGYWLILLKLYIRSFLLGVPKITIGRRTDHGEVKNVQTLDTQTIPLFVHNTSGAWYPSIFMDWWQQFIAFLRRVVLETQDGQSQTVRRVKFTPRVGASIVKLDEEGVKKVAGGENRVGFLPRWYWESESISAHQT